MNREKQIAYWRGSAWEDLHAARVLMEKDCYRHGLFFAPLALEKLLKAHVVRSTAAIPPKIHILPRLAELANLILPDSFAAFIKRFDRYEIVARYPDSVVPHMDAIRAQKLMATAEEVYQWLTAQF
jgi:HEPN domain-containing protein